MPEPTEAGQGAQTGQIASTPAPERDQPTTVTQNDDQQLKGLMEHLDIPPELQSRIAASTQAEPLPSTTPAPETEPPTPPTEEPVEKRDDGEDDEEEIAEEPATPEDQQKVDKRQKRINRLTRQKAQLETQLDSAVSELEQYRQALAQQRPGQTPQPVPSANQRLAHISDEVSLNQEIAKATSVIEWCDANADGLTTEGQDGTEKYHAPEQIAKWRREAEKVVLDAPQRRDEIRTFGVARNQYDQIAQQVWPELFDKSTAEHQAAAQLLAQYPAIRGTPQANYAAGLVIEGVRSLMARLQQANGQQPAKAHRDIDERAFTTPRVPIAPHSPEPPSREAKPSSQRQLNQAMDKLANDPDGSSESLAEAFNALDAMKRTRSDSRSAVKV
jgi:phage host-nuclease inhibitor protein Gam